MRRIINNVKNHSNWLGYYKFKYLENGRESFTFHCRSGFKIKVHRRLLHTYKECFFDETYFRGFPKDIPLSPIRTVIDIGANVGYFSLFVLSRFPEANVFAYEPLPKNFELMDQYRSENSGFKFNIFNKAVTKSGRESLSLYLDNPDNFSTSAGIFKDHEQSNQLIIDSVSLEKIINDHKLDEIDFVKLDCEGSEYDILYDTPSTIYDKISRLAIETHPGQKENQNTIDLSNFLIGQKYNVRIQNDIIWAWWSS